MHSPDPFGGSPGLKRYPLLALALVLGLGVAALWLTGPLAGPVPTAAARALAPESGVPNLISSHKLASQSAIGSGETLTYTIALRNIGTVDGIVTVADQLPAEMAYIAGSESPPGIYDPVAEMLTWGDVIVPAKEVVTLTFAVTAAEVASARVVTNTAVISTDGQVLERWAKVLIMPELPPPSANLASSRKYPSKLIVDYGETFTYTILLRNRGRAEAAADVTDHLPAEAAYVSGSASQGVTYDPQEGTLAWSRVWVPAKKDVALTYAVLGMDVLTPTMVTNTAVISAEGSLLERRAMVLLLPESPPGGPNLWASHKRASRYAVGPGEVLSYTIRLRNRGFVAARADVTDYLPPEMAYVADSASPGAVYDAAAGTLTWGGVSVPPMEDVWLTLAVTATEVTTPMVVANTVVISADGDWLERRVMVLLLPERPELLPNLRGSYKRASRYGVEPGETLTYTIRLHNSGPVAAAAQVVDQLPPELEYVAHSASPAAVYAVGNRTLTWTDVPVAVKGEALLTFAVTAGDAPAPAVVRNTAVISAGGESIERQAAVVLMPERPERDHEPPVVHSLAIDEVDVLTSPTVTLHISATDNVEVESMFLREWLWTARPWPHWKVVQSSGWMPYQAEVAWTLEPVDGAHYVGLWVSDGAHNHSFLDGRGLDFASLLRPGAVVPPFGLVPYLVYYEAGLEVTALLGLTEGEAGLYVWRTGDLSAAIAEDSREVRFPTGEAGAYLFVVRGEADAVYDLSIEPGGGPRRPLLDLLASRAPALTSGAADEVPLGGAGDLIALFGQSGLDPLDGAAAPEEPAPAGQFGVYLPLVVR